MYTIIKACDLLGVSKVTIYKHMAKNGIEKGKRLNDKDIEVLSNSIGKTKKVNDSVYSLLEDKKEYTYKINLLEKKVKELEEKIFLLEKDNRNLLSELQTSQVMVNETQKQNIELLSNSQKLLENKSKWWRKR